MAHKKTLVSVKLKPASLANAYELTKSLLEFVESKKAATSPGKDVLFSLEDRRRFFELRESRDEALQEYARLSGQPNLLAEFPLYRPTTSAYSGPLAHLDAAIGALKKELGKLGVLVTGSLASRLRAAIEQRNERKRMQQNNLVLTLALSRVGSAESKLPGSTKHSSNGTSKTLAKTPS